MSWWNAAMTSILTWDKPKQVMTRDEYEAISADSAPPGVYTPNMSRVDTYKWRAKKVGGRNPRVEIRKSVLGPDPLSYDDGETPVGVLPRRPHCMAQLVVVVMADGRVRMSQNGPAVYTAHEWTELMIVVQEARLALT